MLSVYPLSAYTFGQKSAVTEKHGTVPLRMERLKEKCGDWGKGVASLGSWPHAGA